MPLKLQYKHFMIEVSLLKMVKKNDNFSVHVSMKGKEGNWFEKQIKCLDEANSMRSDVNFFWLL